MKMKKLLLTSFTALSLLMQSTAHAAIALYPAFTDQDLENFGKKAIFQDVYSFFIEKGKGNQFLCSAIKVNFGKTFPIFLTAAHCLEGATGIKVNGFEEGGQPTHFMTHPLFMSNQLDDIGAFWNPQGEESGGALLSHMPVSVALNEPLVSAGYGSTRKGGEPARQAFVTCPSVFDSEVNVISAACSQQQRNASREPMGRITPGDSGGGLFVRNKDGDIELLGIVMSTKAEEATAYGQSNWRLIDQAFLLGLEATLDYAEKGHGPLRDVTHLSPSHHFSDLSQNPKVLVAQGEQHYKNGQIDNALRLFLQAGDVGLAQFCLIKIPQLLQEIMIENKDLDEILKRCLPLAKKGHGAVQYAVSQLYLGNRGFSGIIISTYLNNSDQAQKEILEKNQKESAFWLDEAAKSGHLRAVRDKAGQWSLDGHEKAKYTQILAQHGDAKAQYELAEFYLSEEMGKIIWEGRNSPQEQSGDPVKAIAWLKVAAAAYQPDAEFALAKLKLHGYVDTLNEGGLVSVGYSFYLSQDVLDLLAHAAALGQKEAARFLGDAYAEGKTVQKNMGSAVFYWAKVVPIYALIGEAGPVDNRRAWTMTAAINEGQVNLLGMDPETKNSVANIIGTAIKISDSAKYQFIDQEKLDSLKSAYGKLMLLPASSSDDPSSPENGACQ
jgi:TPR repeat protein